MADILKPDLCIVGAGAAGIGLAMAASARGASVVLVDRGPAEAGDPAQGHLARAAFLATASRAQAIRTAARVGLGAGEPKPNFRAIGEHAAAVAARAAPEQAEERLAALGITCLSGAPAFADRGSLRLGETIIRAGHFVLATGAAPVVPAIPGLDQVSWFTPDTIGDNIRKLSHLVVIGGDATALELAQAYRRLGSDVTLVSQGPLLAGFDPELVAILAGALRDEGVVIMEEAEVTAIVPRNQGTGVTVRRPDGGPQTLDVSHILVALGRVPDLGGDWLEQARLRRDREHSERLQLDAGCRTSNPRISAIAGASGQDQPAVVARQAEIVLDRLLRGGRGSLDLDQVPRQVMCDPALVQVGPLESGTPLRPGQRVLRASHALTHAALAEGRAVGSTKLVVDRKGLVLSGGTVAPGAGELVALLALAVRQGVPVTALGRLLLPEASPATVLAALAAQFEAQLPPDPWARRLAPLRRLIP